MAKAAKPVAGRLAGDAVVVEHPGAAKRLHERLLAGDIAHGGALRLSLTEAAWAAAQGRLTVEDRGATLGPPAVAAAARRLTGGAARLTVYTDLRERGLAVRHAHLPAHPGRADAAGGGDSVLAVWPRGLGIGGPPAYHVSPEGETDAILAADLHARGGVIYGIVDHDGSVTYYEAEPAAPEGGATDDHSEVSPRNEAPPVAAARRALQGAGVTVRSGFRFGTHLRGYRGDPDEEHADWIVDCAAAGDRLPWLQLARGIRVAHGVRKAFLVAVSRADADARGALVRSATAAATATGTSFVELSWFKP